MVSIYMNMEKLQLIIDGHAGADEPGKDLVCCSVSILAQSLSLYMDVREKAGDLKYKINEVRFGKVYIIVTPNEWSEKEIRGAYEVIREGMRALAEDYPDNVKMEEA